MWQHERMLPAPRQLFRVRTELANDLSEHRHVIAVSVKCERARKPVEIPIVDIVESPSVVQAILVLDSGDASLLHFTEYFIRERFAKNDGFQVREHVVIFYCTERL